MSRNVIPMRLRERFKAHMAAHDNDDLPDGAWWAVLEEAAQKFLDTHRINKPWQDANSAAHQYIRMLNEQDPQAAPQGHQSPQERGA